MNIVHEFHIDPDRGVRIYRNLMYYITEQDPTKENL